jgi:hypothetical protein
MKKKLVQLNYAKPEPKSEGPVFHDLRPEGTPTIRVYCIGCKRYYGPGWGPALEAHRLALKGRKKEKKRGK